MRLGHLCLKGGSYIPWASRFKRFLNRKRENQKWLLKALEDGPFVFRNITPTGSTLPRLQEVEDLQGDDLLYYDAEMELIFDSSFYSYCRFTIMWILTLIVDFDEEFEQMMIHNHSEDPTQQSAMWLFAKPLLKNFSNSTTFVFVLRSNYQKSAVVQGDRVNIQAVKFLNSKESACQGFAATLAVLITGASQIRQHSMSEPERQSPTN
ncbi:hypothetical protein Tco_0178750 [Tanacetum coccineum]